MIIDFAVMFEAGLRIRAWNHQTIWVNHFVALMVNEPGPEFLLASCFMQFLGTLQHATGT